MPKLVCLLLLLAIAIAPPLTRAQGGPPFITDDPCTPGHHHWEINLGWTADHNPGNAYYETPDIDMNYGWGDRIQLKYELPMAVYTDPSNTTRAGLGESLFGIKWRPYEHHKAGEDPSDENMNFSLGTYPQASINNSTSAVRRGLVENGPQYYLPVEMTAKLGPINFDGEAGHWFGNQLIPSRWAVASSQATKSMTASSSIRKSTTSRTPIASAPTPSSVSSPSTSAAASLWTIGTTSACSRWAVAPSRPSPARTQNRAGSPTSASSFCRARKKKKPPARIPERHPHRDLLRGCQNQA